MLLGVRIVLIVPLRYKLKPISPRDADTANTLFLVVCSVPAVCEPYGFVPSDCDININTIHEGWCSFLWRRKRDSNPRGFWPNGFQDFLTNPTLTQNNRKYQTIENAESPVNSRDFDVLSFPKPETSSSARISVSKTISKTFLEKPLDKSAQNSPVASHIITAKSAAADYSQNQLYPNYTPTQRGIMKRKSENSLNIRSIHLEKVNFSP